MIRLAGAFVTAQWLVMTHEQNVMEMTEIISLVMCCGGAIALKCLMSRKGAQASEIENTVNQVAANDV